MRNQSILATLLALPLLLLGCDQADQSPSAAAPAEEKQAMSPDSQDKMIERAPPAAGMPASPDAATPATPPAAAPADSTAPADSSAPPAAQPGATNPDEPKKAY